MSNEENNNYEHMREEFFRLFDTSSLEVSEVGLNLEELTLDVKFSLVDPKEVPTSDVLDIVAEGGTNQVVEALFQHYFGEPQDVVEDVEEE